MNCDDISGFIRLWTCSILHVVNNLSKASVHSTGSHLSILSATSEPPQHPLDEEDNFSKDQFEPDSIEIPELETQVPILH